MDLLLLVGSFEYNLLKSIVDISGDSPILPHHIYVSRYPPQWLFLDIVEGFFSQLTSDIMTKARKTFNQIPNASFVSKNNHFGGYPLAYLWWGMIGESTDMFLYHVTQKVNKLTFFFFIFFFFTFIFS